MPTNNGGENNTEPEKCKNTHKTANRFKTGEQRCFSQQLNLSN